MRKKSLKKISCGKLSRLQRLVLVMLSEPGLAVLKRREFNRMAKRLRWGREDRVVAASYSRAMRNLEERQYIRPRDGRWVLTDSNADDPTNTGVTLALLAWAKDREYYGRLGLNGAARGALGFKPKPGVKVELHIPE